MYSRLSTRVAQRAFVMLTGIVVAVLAVQAGARRVEAVDFVTQAPFDSTPPAAVRDLWYVPSAVKGHPRGFFIPAYFPLDESAIQILNERFHLAIVGRDSDCSAINPDIVTLTTGPAVVYSNGMGRADEWSIIDANEDWFLHSSSEISPATRISLSGYSHLFYMNVGSQGWRDFVAARYGDAVLENPEAEGVFVDGVPTPAEYANQVGVAFPDYDSSSYQAAALRIISDIKSSVPGRLVILNSELFKPFTMAVDGGTAEGFVHFGGHANDEQLTRSRWLESIEAIADRAFDGRYLLIGSGSIEATLPSLVEYCYASFLLGYNEAAHCYFYWHSNAEGGYSTVNWSPLWELEIGEPEGDYFESNGIYERSFSEGIVLVNPNDEGGAVTVILGGEHIDSSGNIVTSVTLSNKSAAVLKRAPWSS